VAGQGFGGVSITVGRRFFTVQKFKLSLAPPSWLLARLSL
jgi:hypothetical protein